MLEEKITSTEPIFDGRVVKLDVHTVTLPDGNEGIREMIDHPGAVAIVALDTEDNILLIRQFRLGAGQVMIELPAGTLEPGESNTLEDAAIRELREETGFRPQKIERVGGWYVAPGYSTEYIHLFLARDLIPDGIEGDEDEFIEQLRIPFSEAVEMVHRGEIFNTTAIC
ncbi:MAG: NUDIX hydrolase [Chloroflexota bacterium]